ncbi:hypothetical protein MMC13_001129 [Lambiella insularis]|nr:hypothetical protein [Lambiella insularis]
MFDSLFTSDALMLPAVTSSLQLPYHPDQHVAEQVGRSDSSLINESISLPNAFPTHDELDILPPNKSAEDHLHEVSRMQSDGTIGIEVEESWIPLDHDMEFLRPDYAERLGNVNNQNHDSTSSSSPVTLVRKLAELSVSLSELFSTIPPQCKEPSRYRECAAFSLPEIIGDTVNSRGNATPSTKSKAPVPYFSLPDAFHLTQGLIEIYPRFLLESLEPSISQPLEDLSLPATRSTSNCSYVDDRCTAHSARQNPSGRKRLRHDHASVLLILSCHHRVIDIWERVLDHVLAIPVHLLGKHCPRFQIGSFVPSSSLASIPVEIVMCAEFAAQLHNQVQDFTLGSITPTSAIPHFCTSNVAHSGLIAAEDVQGSSRIALEMECKAVSERANDLVEQVSHVRRVLSQRQQELASFP